MASACPAATDVFVSSAAKIKSSSSSLGFSFLLIHETEERGRRWTGTGETRSKFKTEGGIRFIGGVELTSANSAGDVVVDEDVAVDIIYSV